jgi:hypothetical protein
MEPRVTQDLQVQRELREQQVQQDLQVLQEQREILDLRDQLETTHDGISSPTVLYASRGE